jgi:hypothetical protein
MIKNTLLWILWGIWMVPIAAVLILCIIVAFLLWMVNSVYEFIEQSR